MHEDMGEGIGDGRTAVSRFMLANPLQILAGVGGYERDELN